MTARCFSWWRECHGILFYWSVIFWVLGTVTVSTEPIKPVISRIFLQEGKTLISYGDYVRIGDNVVFSLPISDLAKGNTQLVTVPTSLVDWTATERYSHAVHAAHYASTRGEADFVGVSRTVAEALNEIAFTADVEQRRTLARDTRMRLLSWTASHYGYRENEVHEIVALLDEAIAWPNRPNTDGSLNLQFVATTLRPPTAPLLPDPTLREVIVQAVTAAQLTPVPAERLSLLQTMVDLLKYPRSTLPSEWRLGQLDVLSRDLQAELHTSQEYSVLGRRVLAEAAVNAARADVRGVESLVEEMHAYDAQLGHGRPDFMYALLGAVDARLAEARSLRLERDRWLVRVDVLRDYERTVEWALKPFERSEEMLDDVRLLAGPLPHRLEGLVDRLTETVATLERMDPPHEVEQAHELYRHAVLLALGAVRGRHEAVQSGKLALAWAAASAAAGSLLLFERATEELESALNLPELN